MSSNLAKAELIPKDGGPLLTFMFNPSELAFEGIVETADNPGARSENTGKPKVSFSNIKAYKVTIKNIVFDTFETGDDVVEKYIRSFRQSVEFVPGTEEKRPPIYSFMWGQTYLDYCFVERLNYKLTKFLVDGTPVRAVIESLTLKETDNPSDASGTPKPKTNDANRGNFII